MSRSLADLAASCSRFPEDLQKAQAAGVRAAALHVTGAIRDEIRGATHGSNRLSGVGARGARVGAGFDIKGTVNPVALIQAKGPIQLIENDTRPHEIRPRRRRGHKALKFGDTFAARVMHSGTRGKHPFQKGVERTEHDTVQIFDAEVKKAVLKWLG